MTQQQDRAERREEFRRGVEQFNTEHFFEAHETWEAIWLTASEPDKTFLQGITQVTAAFHHFSRENRKGALSLLRKGLQKLENFPNGYRQMQLEILRAELRVWVQHLEAAKPATALKKPKVHWTT